MSQLPPGFYRGVMPCSIFPSVSQLNLIYHVCPLKTNDVWLANVRQLKKRLSVFNGSKTVAIVTGSGMHSPETVKREFSDASIEYMTLPNDRRLREVQTFLPLLRRVVSTDAREATFYSHTKGNSTADNAEGAKYWRNAMYHALLDNINVCRDLLLTHPCVGTHKMTWPKDGRSPLPTRLSVGNWIFAGTFFWFRNRDVFLHPNWHRVPPDRYGAEAWLSLMFPAAMAATVFQPWPASEYPTPNPYSPKLYAEKIEDDAA